MWYRLCLEGFLGYRCVRMYLVSMRARRRRTAAMEQGIADVGRCRLNPGDTRVERARKLMDTRVESALCQRLQQKNR